MNVKLASAYASEHTLTRRERAIQEAIENGLNVEAVIKRENAIEQAELERKQRLLEYAC